MNQVTDQMQMELEEAEIRMLQLEQAECPVTHFFGPGVYIRQVEFKKGTVVMGHSHKFENINIMLTGKLALLGENKEIRILEAPQTFLAPPGRKIAYVLEDTIWQNVHATEETDVEKIEDLFIEKSESWKELRGKQKCHGLQQP